MSIPEISPTEFANRPYDYIIVGGGTAGLVVATRLSEDPRINVGVIEAGVANLDDVAINVPGRYGEGIGTDNDWSYETLPQAGLKGRRLPWPREKVLGGTSALNFMAWNRPNKEDLDAWEELGNQGWGWDDLYPFYKKSERFTAPTDERRRRHDLNYDMEALGTDGPVPITFSKNFSASHEHWHETFNALGVPTNKSHLSGSNIGVWTSILALEPNSVTRSYSANTYYLPNATRTNLAVLTNASAREIILSKHSGSWIATGVRYACNGQQYVANARKEIIVAGGSVASPQLLELSGIGDPAVLARAGIDVKVSNPNVGTNVQDHIMFAQIYEVDPSVASPDDLRSDPVQAAAADKLYATSQEGPRTVVPSSTAYLPLSEFHASEEFAAIAKRASATTKRDQILARRLTDPIERKRLGYIEYILDVGNWNPFFPAEPGKKYLTLLQILQYPFSRGSIHISPETPTGKPMIDPQYYGGEQGELDLDIMHLCADFADKLVETQPLKDMILKRVCPPAGDVDDRKEWIMNNTITDWHPVGTCGMGGTAGIKEGVVDERLRVYGVHGLRVADASIMPLQISAHLQATVYAIAEKASHMILEDHYASGCRHL